MMIIRLKLALPPRTTFIVLLGVFVFCSASLLEKAQTSCEQACSPYDNTAVRLPCVGFCETKPELFDADYPYVFGPLEMKAYPELTGIDGTEVTDLVGTLFARVSATRDKIQFRYKMNANPQPFFPYFAMHLHEGMLNQEEIGGKVIVSIAGRGDLIGSFGLSLRSLNFVPCHEHCTDGNEALGNCIKPKWGSCLVNNLNVGHAYFCKGGCQGDNRISGNISQGLPGLLHITDTVVPSRFCDLNTNNPSNPVQDTWIQGVHSSEFSGNPEDDDYSPYSIARPENFDLWCGDSLPFLVDQVLSPGSAGYVALHLNWNATGLPALLYGDIFTQLSSRGSGPQSCYIFGDMSHPCTSGLGDLPPIGQQN